MTPLQRENRPVLTSKSQGDAFKNHTGNKLQQKFITFHNMKGIFKVMSPQVVPSRTLALNKVHIRGGLTHGAAGVYMGGVTMGAALLFTYQREGTTHCCLM